jgi:hypothetical protein
VVITTKDGTVLSVSNQLPFLFSLSLPQLAPCRTSLAYYSHASPAFQAFRGRCLCYSGRFICMRPPHGEYTLPGGIYLLLGFSSTDEALLRPHTNLGVQDAVRALQQYIVNYVNNQVSQKVNTHKFPRI